MEEEATPATESFPDNRKLFIRQDTRSLLNTFIRSNYVYRERSRFLYSFSTVTVFTLNRSIDVTPFVCVPPINFIGHPHRHHLSSSSSSISLLLPRSRETSSLYIVIVIVTVIVITVSRRLLPSTPSLQTLLLTASNVSSLYYYIFYK